MISCEDTEKGPIVLETVTAPAITYPAAGATLVMTKPQADLKTAFKWSAAEYGVPLGILYTIQIDKEAGTFASPVDVASVNALADTLKYSEFNAKMVALETNMEAANPIKVRIKASVPNSSAAVVYSAPVTMTVTPYTAKDNIYLVGQHNGWNNGTANTMNRSLSGLKYELYLNLTAVDQGFKILPTLGSWDGDIGEDPANAGKLIATGEKNMQVAEPGYWRISVDLQAMTWSALKTTWALIGDFNGWGGDQAMTYDAVNGVWTATFDIAAAGGLKFRANGGWSINYGDTGADGKLELDGANISIASAGNYTFTLNLNPTGNPQAYTYTVKKN
jgi:hypothetical protein